MMTLEQHRETLLQLYQRALDAVSGEAAVNRFLTVWPISETCSVIALGKAAAAMALGAQQALGERLRSGLVITKQGHSDHRLDGRRIEQIEGAHPIPDERSLTAGEALLKFLQVLPEGEPLLFLLSGGASALAEVLPPRMSPSQLSELNRWLLASGLSISEVNGIRRRLSLIKGGKLLPYLRGRRCLQLVISDVPGDDLAVIGSGPLIPSHDVVAETASLPHWLQGLMQIEERGEFPAADHVETHIIASNDLARAAVVEAARQLDLPVHDHPGHFEGDVLQLANRFCNELLEGEEGLYLWGGESSVVLPEHPGRGGRNQHMALAAARCLTGHDRVMLLVAGTDGSDGPTEEAGALVDGGTLRRGTEEGEDAVHALTHADSGAFLEASGDLINTGPSGTNVMDLVMAWRW